MTGINERQDSEEFREERDSLWRLSLGPVVWSLHFVISYGAAALICARFADLPDANFWLRAGIAALTVLALAIIGTLGWRAWKQWDMMRDPEWENDQSHGEDRHQFLGHAAFLLAVISAIGVIYVALPIFLTEGCG